MLTLKASGRQKNAIKLRWDKVKKPVYGSNIVYRLCWDQGNTKLELEEFKTVDPEESNAHAFKNLEPASPYRIAVRAENESGCGPWSDVLLVTTQADASKPGYVIRHAHVHSFSKQ